MSYVDLNGVDASEVKRLQTRMKSLGFLPSTAKVDGIPGPQTFSGLVKWARYAVDMVKAYAETVKKFGGAPAASDVLKKRADSESLDIAAAEKTGDVKSLQTTYKNLYAMYRTAANNVGQKVEQRTHDFFNENFLIAGDKIRLASASSTSSSGGAAKTETVPPPKADPTPLKTAAKGPGTILAAGAGLLALGLILSKK